MGSLSVAIVRWARFQYGEWGGDRGMRGEGPSLSAPSCCAFYSSWRIRDPNPNFEAEEEGEDLILEDEEEEEEDAAASRVRETGTLAWRSRGLA